MPTELIEGFFGQLMAFVIILFLASLPMAVLSGRKKYGALLLYLPVWLLIVGFATKNVLPSA